MKVRSNMKAGMDNRFLTMNHNESMNVRSNVKSGGVQLNHSEGMKVRTSVTSGARTGPWPNHNEGMKACSSVKSFGYMTPWNEKGVMKGMRVRSHIKAGDGGDEKTGMKKGNKPVSHDLTTNKIL
jgi:hypothetical protein